MKRALFAAGFCALALCLPMAAAAQPAPATPLPAPPGKAGGLPPGEGREATIRVCGGCHDAGLFAEQDLDAAGWKQTVDEMAKMSDGSDDDFAAITAYLSRAFPGK